MHPPRPSPRDGTEGENKANPLGAARGIKKAVPLQLRMIRLPGQVRRQVVELDHNMYIAIQVCRPSESTVSGNPRWGLRAQPKEEGLATLICTCAESLDRITRFYVVPDLGDVIHGCKIFGEGHRILTAGRRLQCLAEFCDVATEPLSNRKPQDNGLVARGDVVFTLRSSTVTVAGRERCLPPTTAEVFKLLVNNAGVLVSRETFGASRAWSFATADGSISLSGQTCHVPDLRAA